MTELLRELGAVALLAEKASNDEPWQVDEEGDVVCNGEDVAWAITNKLDAPYIAALNNLFRTHHAEIAEALRDAERWHALHWAEAPMVTVTGSQLARGIRPGDFAVPWDWPVTSRTRIRMIVMNNSAREVGE